MRINDISVDNVGVLQDVQLNEIPTLSVIRGGHGSGKTTLVRFLKETLLSSRPGAPDYPHASRLGTVSLSDSHHRWQLVRYQAPDGHQSTVVRHRDNPTWTGSIRDRFPTWVSDQVFQEILCPGYEDADRFVLLTRLCLETGGRATADSEIRRAEQAIAQAVREREGTAIEPGVSGQITDLERRREQLQMRLADLQRQDPALPGEIRSTEERISSLRLRNSQIEEECRSLRDQIATLERRLQDLHSHNRLALDQQQLQTQLADITRRRTRWAELRSSIEQASADPHTVTTRTVNRSAHSVQAVVRRLEDRMEQRPASVPEQWQQTVEQETAALCEFVSQQQSSVRQWQQAQEAQLAADALAALRRLEQLLDAQAASIREELDRAENILDESLHRGMAGCDSVWHRSYQYRNGSDPATVAALQQELQQCKDRLSALLSEEAANTHDIRILTDRLNELRRQLKAVPSLEEIDDLRAQLAETEARLELLVSHRDVLLRTEQSLRQVILRLQERRTPAVLDLASPWLRTLTDGECQEIVVSSSGTELQVRTINSAVPLRIEQLSRGTQHELALVLRLALLQVHAETGDRVPLVIDDVFLTSDDRRGAAAANLLKEVASRGQQIVMLTCQNDVSALLAARGARVYSLQETVQTLPVPEAEPVVDDSLVYKAFDGVAEECPGELEDRTLNEGDDSHWLFYLEPEHSLTELSGLEVSELSGLNAAGLHVVDDLLVCSIDDVRARISAAGFFLTEDRLKDLRTQAVMGTCIPMLRQRDAELLIAAGIDSVRQLARLRPEAIHELIVRFQRSDSGARFLRSGRTIDRQQAISWNRWALHARTTERAREASAARRGSSRSSSGILSSAQRRRSSLSRRRERVRRSGETQRKLVRTRSSEEDRRRREARSERRRQRLNRSERLSIEAEREAQEEAELKFYLHRSSVVEDAPSIGPKTAARLGRVGVESVNDLLECNAETIATLLDNRRITSQVIEQWKAQAALVCTVPRLRGHDAQILVACGKYSPEDIRGMRAEDLFSLVQPFCETTEGTRIVRGGRKPDLKEVSDWIAWARQSRSLRAA